MKTDFIILQTKEMAKKKLVVLTGAGISAESGLKTFRDSDGLWEGYDINEVATPRGWKKNPHLVLQFYNMRSVNNEELVYEIQDEILVGHVAEDGGQLRPHIVWFEEPVPMIETAAGIAQTADILVVIGTSLVVYPAAGLVHYAASYVPKFIIDKNIPDTAYLQNITAIEKPATEGVKELMVLLDKLKG